MISREEFWRLFRFGLVGGGATLIYLGTSALMLWRWPHLAQNLVSTSAFFLCCLLVFVFWSSLHHVPEARGCWQVSDGRPVLSGGEKRVTAGAAVDWPQWPVANRYRHLGGYDSDLSVVPCVGFCLTRS